MAKTKKVVRGRGRPSEPLMKRLMKQTKLNGRCLEWTGSRNNIGYGVIRSDGSDGKKPRTITTHRAAWLAKHGAIPAGQQVLHLCNNKLCIRLSHLELGDIKRNMAYRQACGNTVRGAKHGMAKLSGHKVRAIRQRYASTKKCKNGRKYWTQKRLAKTYNISQFMISHIVNYKSWKHIK